jgi:hypothetical protein
VGWFRRFIKILHRLGLVYDASETGQLAWWLSKRGAVVLATSGFGLAAYAVLDDLWGGLTPAGRFALILALLFGLVLAVNLFVRMVRWIVRAVYGDIVETPDDVLQQFIKEAADLHFTMPRDLLAHIDRTQYDEFCERVAGWLREHLGEVYVSKFYSPHNPKPAKHVESHYVSFPWHLLTRSIMDRMMQLKVIQAELRGEQD